MSSESQLQTWSYLRQQISDNLNFSCPPDAQISVVTSRDPAAKVWHALAVQARNNCKTVVLIDQGSSVELALKGLFIKSAYHVHRHLSLKKTSKVSPPTPSGRPPSATRQPEEPAYDSSSDDSDWEELKLQANITRAKNFLNRYETAAPLNVLTTISRPTRRALLIGAIACVGQQDTSGYRAKARRAHLDGVACDMALFAADDLSFFFGKETVPFFEVEVWRESSTEQLNSDADGDDDEDEA
ncbi:Sad1-interacting factor 3 [Verticillium dahliae VDG1]|nr:Sad1-interacting factor 3 [Verticillium dahliae VDG1]